MKLLLRLSVGLLPILSGACASLPGTRIVAAPAPLTVEALPPPSICLQTPVVPAMQPTPDLPPLIPPPVATSDQSRRSAAWWEAVAAHFESRARRAELTQSFAVNIADAEREAREANAATQIACADRLRAREEQTPVG